MKLFFFYQYSDLLYVHLQMELNSEEIVQGKLAFEAYSKSMGVKIQQYHADNERFADNLFLDIVQTSNQTIFFCSVGAHRQNGRSEKRIIDLHESARKMILHSISKRPKEINIHLWPYALRHASIVSNMVPDNIDGRSKLECFAQVQVASLLKNFLLFGCPLYAWHNEL